VTGVRAWSFIVILVISLLAQGCASQFNVVEFEVLEPATVEFPEHVNQLLFLNRAPITLDNWAVQNQVEMDRRQLVILDTLLINNLLRSVLDVLRSSPADKFHTPIYLSERRTDTAYLEDLQLTRLEVDNLCEEMGADVIISLEYYTAGMNQHFEYYSDSPEQIRNQYFEVSNSLKWNIHLPGSPRPFDSYTTVDTMFFQAVLEGEFLDFLPGVDMIRTLFSESGFKYGSYLVPVWNQTSRVLYRGRNDSLKKAATFTDEGMWEDAYTIWKHLTASEDSTLAARAYHNMAVYFELEDNLDSASIMLNQSLKYDTLDMDVFYREELDVRILNRKNILNQVK